ncbi:hypothetical protein [Roseateles chitosanitabidus]|uniref:hypothetical protein n=1 Tax=Roseateles chitosanitabidus TaxID=65048 RepID=UPI00082C52BD|nr:hypothetical protein [Roseateles chitosanitabidus]
MSTPRLLALALSAGVGLAHAGADAGNPAADPAAMNQLVEAVSLDVVSEAALGACDDLGASSAARLREAWVAWRTRHQIAPMRVVLTRAMQRRSGDPPWDRIATPTRQKLLDAPDPERACAALPQELQDPGMDIGARFPRAPGVARALVQAKLVMPPTPLPVATEPARGQVLLPTQVIALTERHGNWLVISEEAARRRLGPVYVKGLVARDLSRPENFHLVLAQGDRRSPQRIDLKFNAEPWVGREIVLRGMVTSLNRLSMDLAGAALVSDPSGLSLSPLPQTPLARQAVPIQRVTTAPGQGLGDRDLAAVVVHGEANSVQGTRWDEDVRFLLRDGSVYRRTEMPPDQLDVAASRRLEPQRWGRWRAAGKGYEMQAQDDDGHPAGDWKPERHEAVRPWPADARLAGSFTRSAFTGSMVTGGTSSTRGIRFTQDGRFERSFTALSSTGSLQAITGTVVAGSSQGDGTGSSRTGTATVGTGTGTVGVSSGTRARDDGASRRGRYRLGGYAITLEYDDGHKERLLSFPVDDARQSVYIGTGSYDREK